MPSKCNFARESALKMKFREQKCPFSSSSTMPYFNPGQNTDIMSLVHPDHAGPLQIITNFKHSSAILAFISHSHAIFTSIAAHPSFMIAALILDRCYRLGQISHASSGCDWIACAVAPCVLATHRTSEHTRVGHVCLQRCRYLTQLVRHEAPDGLS